MLNYVDILPKTPPPTGGGSFEPSKNYGLWLSWG